MNADLDPDDRAILEAVESLGMADTADIAGVHLRAYTELFALLAYTAEPATPRPETKARILAGLPGAESRLDLASVSEMTLVKFPARTAVAASSAASVAAAARPPRAAFALAAALAFCLLGMGYFFGRTQEQRVTIARLEGDLDAAEARAAVLQIQSADLERIREHFEMITRVARHAYPMRPMENGSPSRPLNGTVFVCGQHQQWYLNVRGLRPAPPAHEYHMWFVTAKGMIDAGAVEIKDGTAELNAPNMPVGTKGFAITLETAGPHAKPQGALLLLGDRPVAL